MKQHIYFREDLQELKTLPINEPNCYYLGELGEKELETFTKWLKISPSSFIELSRKVKNGDFRPNGG